MQQPIRGTEYARPSTEQDRITQDRKTQKHEITEQQRKRMEENRRHALERMRKKARERVAADVLNSATECAVCLNTVSSSEEATLSGCLHKFCFSCIKSWSEIETSCPLCKKHFAGIQHKGTWQRVTTKKQRVECGDLPSVLDDMQCMRCRSGENEESLLLCDRCDKACHLWCANPPLIAVPEGDWFCSECASRN